MRIVIALLGVAIFAAGVMYVSGKASAVACSGNPSVPGVFNSTPGPDKGQLTLSWNLSSNIDNYNLLYGYKSGKTPKDYPFGARVGNEKVNSFIVRSLKSGTNYFFRLMTRCGGGPASYSTEISARAK